MFIRRKYLVAGAFALTIPCLLAFVRWEGERRFEVVPEPFVPSAALVDTRLHGSVARLLDSASLVAPDLHSGLHRVSLEAPDLATPPRRSAMLELGDARDALLARLQLIDGAERRIDAQYYTVEADESGHAVLDALAQAADRGVEVRLLIDDIGLVGREAELARLVAEHEHLQIRVFNPTWLRRFRPIEMLARFPRANRRMHNKSLTVDGVATVVGGRNIGDAYFDVDTTLAFEDLDVLAVGAAAEDVVEAFEGYWFSGIAFDVGLLGTAEEADRADSSTDRREALARFRAEIDARDDLPGARLLGGLAEPLAVSASALRDDASKVLAPLRSDAGSLAPRILEILRSAREELLLSSPYLIPGDEGMAVFRELRERGVRVTVLTNSFAANDVAAVHAGYRDYRVPLLEAGVDLHEFKPDEDAPRWSYANSFLGSTQAALHAKAFVVDRRTSFVGSFNLDPRSALHNTEMGLLIGSEPFAERLHAHLSDSVEERAWRVLPARDGGLEWRDGDGTVVAGEDPDTVWAQRALAYLASWLPVEWLL